MFHPELGRVGQRLEGVSAGRVYEIQACVGLGDDEAGAIGAEGTRGGGGSGGARNEGGDGLKNRGCLFPPPDFHFAEATGGESIAVRAEVQGVDEFLVR